MIPVGAFELHSRLGLGGMGEVWRGVHKGQLVPVAVKLLTGELAREQAYHLAFRDEVRAVAGLDHSNVVVVFDYGTVDASAVEASKGALVRGTPWLSMELAEGGSLEGLGVLRSWTQIRGVLVPLLDALGHAHSRGVVHRDIKPANVLVLRDGTLKLTDFGLAHAMDRHDGEFTAGTPSYMAPEQFLGQWREYGPWTDLYAVGCLVHALSTGRPPFGTLGEWNVAMDLHHKATPPGLTPAFPVPAGFAEWTARLLSKDPADRWRRAADALAALDSLGEPASRASTPVRVTGSDPTRTMVRPASSSAAPQGLVEGVAAAAVPAAADDVPPIPASWRRPEGGARSPRLVGAGLGLFGLRTLPVVGRVPQQDALWSALKRVYQTRRAEVQIVQGPSGCGKSRLGQWLSERAHEVGAASCLVAKPAEGGGGDAIGAMILRWLRCSGLPRKEVHQRLAAHLAHVGIHDPPTWAAATEAVWPRRGSTRLGVGRRRALIRLLGALSAERSLVIWVDDGQRCPAAVDLCRGLLEEPSGVPVLVVVTTRDGTSAVPDPYAALQGREGVAVHRLGPLAETDRAELVRHVLSLEPDLALEVERRTGGDPLFAVQMVGQWVRQGLLEPGRQGYRLREGAKADAPADLRRLWEERVSTLLIDRPEADAEALEIAAVLGEQLDERLWKSVMRQTGGWVSTDLVDALTASELARRVEGRPDRWAFAHGLVRSVLEDRALQQGRLIEHHRRCVKILGARTGAGLQERAAHHHLEAGEPQRAVGPLLHAVDERLAAGDHGRANELLMRRERVIEQLNPDENHLNLAEGWTRWARLALRLGRLTEAMAWCDRALIAARNARWGRVLADAHLLMSEVARRRGDVAMASRHLFEAERIAQADPTGWRTGIVRLEGARLLRQRGETARATDALRQARVELEACEDRVGVADVLYELSLCAFAERQTGAAQALLNWAEERYQWLRCVLGEARCQLLGAAIARVEGRQEQAGILANRSVEAFRRIGAADVRWAELELAQQAASRGELDRAEMLARKAARTWSVQQEAIALDEAEAVLRQISAVRQKAA
ncbi:MAG: serine/threonine-protein kinase PknK [Myxococcota bacterium]